MGTHSSPLLALVQIWLGCGCGVVGPANPVDVGIANFERVGVGLWWE